jgi:hypothetical protein
MLTSSVPVKGNSGKGKISAGNHVQVATEIKCTNAVSKSAI